MAVKKMRAFKYLLVGLFIFGMNVGITKADQYENYYGITMTNQQYNNLIGLGFSEDEIYYMDLTTFNENKDHDATIVAKETKYYKSITTAFESVNGQNTFIEITKEEYENAPENNTRSTVTTTYKSMTSTISANGSKYRYKVSLSWRQMPSVRNFDVIAVGYEDNNIYINSDIYFYFYYCNSSNTCTTSSQYYDKKSLSTGGSIVYKLPSSSASLSATLYYDISKSTSSTVTSLSMCGDYSHATETVSATNISNYTVNLDGIILGDNIYDSYDAIPCAPANWSGSW